MRRNIGIGIGMPLGISNGISGGIIGSLSSSGKTVVSLGTDYKKPIYGVISGIAGPFYDPYDIHIHRPTNIADYLKKTNRYVFYEQNHREPMYSINSPITNNDTNDTSAVVCEICHCLLDKKNSSKKKHVKKISEKVLEDTSMINYTNYSDELLVSKNNYRYEKDFQTQLLKESASLFMTSPCQGQEPVSKEDFLVMEEDLVE